MYLIPNLGLLQVHNQLCRLCLTPLASIHYQPDFVLWDGATGKEILLWNAVVGLSPGE